MKDMDSGNIKLHRRFIKSYKSNTMAIFFSFVLTFLLLTTMLILMHTNHRVANIQDKALFTPSDCYIKKLSEQQIARLSEDKTISYLAVGEEGSGYYLRNNQNVFLNKGNDELITMMATVIDGRLPENEGEVAAEKWTLLNLGLEPVIHQDFVIQDYKTGESKTVKLTGILTDMNFNKKYGALNLYSALNKKTEAAYLVYLKFEDNVDYDTKINSLIGELGIDRTQVKKCPAVEDFKELHQTDLKVITVLLILCMVVFYGVYRIASITREKQYGILRAVGMKRKQLRKMLLLELYQIYIVSVPIGVGLGMLLSYFIIIISGDNNQEIYLFNEKVRFVPVIPVWQILFCVVIAAFLVGIVGVSFAAKVGRAPIVETISGVKSDGKSKKSVFGIEKSRSKMSTVLHMGCKYIFRDLRTSCFVVLTICLGATLFTGLAYRVRLLTIYREDTKEMWYLNGQYAMTMMGFNRAAQGISRQSAKEIQKLKDITSVKTSSGIPIRVVDDIKTVRNDAYYDELNATMQEIYGYSNAGYDGTNQIYKSFLCGYNQEALEELKKYVISGDFNPEKIGEDEIILSVLRTDDTKENEFPGNFKEGTPLMQYETGDLIQIKYRKDLGTDSLDYDRLTDTEAEYIYKTYKISAIVSFEYMYDCNRTVYPLFITSDQQIQQIAPDSGFQCMYVDGRSGMSLQRQMKLEQQLIQICSRNSNISTRSLISDIAQNEMFYHKQMLYVYGIAVIAFVLVMINMINNLRYRMRTRTKEISMLRAIGMSIAMSKRMLLFENLILGTVSIAAAFALSQPVLRYLYQLSDMRAFGHSFQFDYSAFAAVSIVSLLICAALSFGIMKSWKTKKITEEIGNLE